MSGNNPYLISFGKIPKRYINRSLLVDDLFDALNSDEIEEQAFKLTGIRGTGKTVAMTYIERELRKDKKWIVVDVRSNSDILSDVMAQLYNEEPLLTDYIDANLNLSAFGIGLNITKKNPIASIDVAYDRIFKEIKKRKKRVLISIDEARKTDAMVDFVQELQILIRREYPIFLLVAGLYEDIESIENTDGLTFFLRAEKYDMKPLNIEMIKEDYRKTISLSDDVAERLAEMTKGYAFAYQAFGKYMWESSGDEITNMVLAQVDEALSERVYDKIWSELSPRDRLFLQHIAVKDSMQVSELLESMGKRHNEWSEPRAHLIKKGIIDCSQRGLIRLKLPRMKEYVERKMRE